MLQNSLLSDVHSFTETLFEKLKQICPGLNVLEFYEFKYCMETMHPAEGWNSLQIDKPAKIENQVNDFVFYKNIQIKQKVDGNIMLDAQILRLTQMLFVGLVTGFYSAQWINQHFYFDVRSFLFYHRTEYFPPSVLAHFNGQPLASFEKKQLGFELLQGVGYKEFKAANQEVDNFFIQSMQKLVEHKKTPILLAIAGPTAAGKTEIVERLTEAFTQTGRQVTSIELDNFLTDRDYREAHGIDSEGKQALHFELLKNALSEITKGQKVCIPRYDFVEATSSHDISGKLKPGGIPLEVEPADIVFMEGNFPFLLDEVVDLIGVKAVYLTDDPIRLKRKWKRDMDYRKKYQLNYFRNRYFKDQFIMAKIAYLPQLEICDLAVNTTQAVVWAAPGVTEILQK